MTFRFEGDNMDYLLEIKEKIDELGLTYKEVAYDLNYNNKTLYNHLSGKTKDMGYYNLLKLLNYLNKRIDDYNLEEKIFAPKMPEVENLSTNKILTQYVTERIKIIGDLHLSDIDTTSIKEKYNFLRNIENLEDKYHVNGLFTIANYPEFEFLRCMFNSPNLKKWVNDLQNEFKSIAKCKTGSNIKDIDTYINEKCKNMTEKEKEEYLLKYSGNKEKYGEEVARQIKIARANIDEINHKFFQKLLNEYYESEYME